MLLILLISYDKLIINYVNLIQYYDYELLYKTIQLRLFPNLLNELIFKPVALGIDIVLVSYGKLCL